MNDESQDPLLNALSDDALPVAGALAAKRRQRERRSIRQAAVALMAVVLTVGGVWRASRPAAQVDQSPMAKYESSLPTPPKNDGQTFVMAVREGDPEVLPSNLSEEERTVMASLPGVPVLIVQRPDGGIARIHVFDR